MSVLTSTSKMFPFTHPKTLLAVLLTTWMVVDWWTVDKHAIDYVLAEFQNIDSNHDGWLHEDELRAAHLAPGRTAKQHRYLQEVQKLPPSFGYSGWNRSFRPSYEHCSKGDYAINARELLYCRYGH